MDNITCCSLSLLLLFYYMTNRITVAETSDDVEIEPMNALVFVGERWTYKCTLPPTSDVDINSVRWEMNDVSLEKDYTVLDNHTALLNVEIKDDFHEDIIVGCYHDNGLGFSSSVDTYVERPVQNISDFTAYYLYEERLRMTWSLNQRYKRPERIGVQLCWSNSSDFNYSRCSDSALEPFNITDVDSLSTMSNIYIRITVYHKKWENRPTKNYPSTMFATNATSQHTINIFKATKSGPPEKLSATSLNGSCINVAWSDPRYLMLSQGMGSFSYNINYTQTHTRNFWETADGKYTNESVPIVLCGLRPFSEYKLSVRVKRYETQPWSDWSYVDTQTPEDRPLTGPPLTSTSFNTSECSHGRRDVFVYWKTPDSLDLQGILTGFEVEAQPDANVKFEKTLISSRNYAHLSGLECHVKYKISVYSTTKVGRSLAPSVIIIPEYKKFPEEVIDFRVEEFSNSAGRFHATWKISNHSDFVLVIYSCKENSETLTCWNDYVYTEVKASANGHPIDVVDPSDILFGYALKLASGQTVGLRWTKCIFNKDNAPGPPSGLQVVTGKDFGSLEISWKSEPCNPKYKAVVQFYTVYVCDGKNVTHLYTCLNWDLNATQDNLTLHNLENDHDYNITIRATSPYKVTGTVASFLVGRTKFNLIGFIIKTLPATLAAVAVLGYTAYIAVNCRKSQKKFDNLNKMLAEDFFNTENKSESLIDRTDSLPEGSTAPSTPQLLTRHTKISTSSSDEGIGLDTGIEPQSPCKDTTELTTEPILPTSGLHGAHLFLNCLPPSGDVSRAVQDTSLKTSATKTDSELTDRVVIETNVDGCGEAGSNSESGGGLSGCKGSGCHSKGGLQIQGDYVQMAGNLIDAGCDNTVAAVGNDGECCYVSSDYDIRNFSICTLVTENPAPSILHDQESDDYQPHVFINDTVVIETDVNGLGECGSNSESVAGFNVRMSPAYQPTNGLQEPSYVKMVDNCIVVGDNDHMAGVAGDGGWCENSSDYDIHKFIICSLEHDKPAPTILQDQECDDYQPHLFTNDTVVIETGGRGEWGSNSESVEGLNGRMSPVYQPTDGLQIPGFLRLDNDTAAGVDDTMAGVGSDGEWCENLSECDNSASSTLNDQVSGDYQPCYFTTDQACSDILDYWSTDYMSRPGHHECMTDHNIHTTLSEDSYAQWSDSVEDLAEDQSISNIANIILYGNDRLFSNDLPTLTENCSQPSDYVHLSSENDQKASSHNAHLSSKNDQNASSHNAHLSYENNQNASSHNAHLSSENDQNASSHNAHLSSENDQKDINY